MQKTPLRRSRKEASLESIQKTLREQNVCYVLITCKEPTADGHMQVEMFYEGDETLAAYLVDNAQQIFEEKQGLQKLQ